MEHTRAIIIGFTLFLGQTALATQPISARRRQSRALHRLAGP